MNPEEYLELAAEWVNGDREGEWRSAVSRAYYAVFHVASQLLTQAGFAVPDSERAHAYLWRRLANSGHPDVQRAGNDFAFLRSMRNRADYDMNRPFTQAVALGQVQVALDLVPLLRLVAASPSVLERITTAIRDYESNTLHENTWQGP